MSIKAEAIAIGILGNCLMKLALAVALGAPRFARVTGSTLAVMAAAIGLSISCDESMPFMRGRGMERSP